MGGAETPPRGEGGGKSEKMKKTGRDIDEGNSFMKFELNPITLKGPKIGGTVFGPVTQNLLFGHNEKKFAKMAKIAMDSKYDFCAQSFETKFDFLGRIL